MTSFLDPNPENPIAEDPEFDRFWTSLDLPDLGADSLNPDITSRGRGLPENADPWRLTEDTNCLKGSRSRSQADPFPGTTRLDLRSRSDPILITLSSLPHSWD